MSDKALLAGRALRRLRKRQGLTQSAMADRLEISSSYLNLIERNQRPVTARVLVQLIEKFGFDPRDLSLDASIGGVEGMVRRLADQRFADLAIDREEIDELVLDSPQFAAAFARIYDQKDFSGEDKRSSPSTLTRLAIQRWQNHFSELDYKAEALADEMRLSRADLSVALAERLRTRHQLSVRILPREVMRYHRRRLDLHARQVQLAEMLGPRSRAFQLAAQIAELEHRDDIQALVDGAELEGDDTARGLLTRHLESYFAAALIMPYSRFIRACEATGYDLPVLLRRFEVSFEQLAHRLTTLQRVGQRGLPFFMVRTDRAGQVSKLLLGASGADALSTEALCPLWIATKTFERQGEMLSQSISIADRGAAPSHWLCVARTVSVGGAMAASGRFSVTLGLNVDVAASLSHARGVDLGESAATRIGPGCRRCHRDDCDQRSLPPDSRRLVFDPMGRSNLPFPLVSDPAA